MYASSGLFENNETRKTRFGGSSRLEHLMVVGLVFAGWMAAGCASFQDFRYEQGQHWRARAEYRRCSNAGRSKFPKDYKRGWLDGFNEVTTGGPDCPPAIAPNRYWDPDQVLDDCDQRRQAYYSGWQDGAARASAIPDTHFLKVFETPECPFPRCECSTGECNCSTSVPQFESGGTVMTDSPGSSSAQGHSSMSSNSGVFARPTVSDGPAVNGAASASGGSVLGAPSNGESMPAFDFGTSFSTSP